MMRTRFGRYTVVALISVIIGGVLGAGCPKESHDEIPAGPAPTPMIHPGAKKPAEVPTIGAPASNSAAPATK
jgi:hypothetical protein